MVLFCVRLELIAFDAEHGPAEDADCEIVAELLAAFVGVS